MGVYCDGHTSHLVTVDLPSRLYKGIGFYPYITRTDMERLIGS